MIDPSMDWKERLKVLSVQIGIILSGFGLAIVGAAFLIWMF